MCQTTKKYCSPSPTNLRALCLLVVLALLLGLGGCLPATGQKTQTLRVGVALYKQDDTFISIVLQAMERIAREEEAARGVKINLSVADGRSNQTAQMEQIDRFIDQGCDVLFVNVVDRTAAAVLIDKARTADIPIIFFNRQPVEEDIERWEQVYYVGAQAEQSGIMQGQIVLQAWRSHQEDIDRNGDGVLQYLMLEGEPGHQDALLRTQYSILTLTEAGVQVEKLASNTANWNRGQAAGQMARWLEEYGDAIEVVFSNNDDMALGAIDALKEAGLTPQDMPLVVGVDATPPALEAVKEGSLYGTVSNPAEAIAQTMLAMGLALLQGQSPADAASLEDGHYVWLPYQMVVA